MARFTHSFIVESDIGKVWKFYTNINHLIKITPQNMRLEILETEGDDIREGAECTLQARILTRSRWSSKITRLEPYEYVDEMSGGAFRSWKHLHRFRSAGQNKTEVIDQIEFELPFGVLGRAFEPYALRKLGEVFDYRKRATIRELSQKSQV